MTQGRVIILSRPTPEQALETIFGVPYKSLAKHLINENLQRRVSNARLESDPTGEGTPETAELEPAELVGP